MTHGLKLPTASWETRRRKESWASLYLKMLSRVVGETLSRNTSRLCNWPEALLGASVGGTPSCMKLSDTTLQTQIHPDIYSFINIYLCVSWLSMAKKNNSAFLVMHHQLCYHINVWKENSSGSLYTKWLSLENKYWHAIKSDWELNKCLISTVQMRQCVF